jgi:hypothetical protein
MPLRHAPLGPGLRWGRACLIALLLAACATSPAGDEAGALRGCWIQTQGIAGEIVTMQRWMRHGDVWSGTELLYAPGVAPEPATGWEVRRVGKGFQLCQIALAMASAPPCLNAFFGAGRAVGDETDWAEIAAAPENLKIAIVISGVRSVLFDGRRDGCD